MTGVPAEPRFDDRPLTTPASLAPSLILLQPPRPSPSALNFAALPGVTPWVPLYWESLDFAAQVNMALSLAPLVTTRMPTIAEVRMAVDATLRLLRPRRRQGRPTAAEEGDAAAPPAYVAGPRATAS